MEDPIVCDDITECSKKFKARYKNCSVVYVAYPDKEFISEELHKNEEALVAEWARQGVETGMIFDESDYDQFAKICKNEGIEPSEELFKHYFKCVDDLVGVKEESLELIADEGKKVKDYNNFIGFVKAQIRQDEEALKRAGDNEEVKAAIQKRLNGHKEDLEKALSAIVEIENKVNGVEAKVDGKGEQAIQEDIEEETETCAWCGEEYPISELHKEVDLGYLCPYCEQAIKSRGEKLIFEE